MSSNPVLWRCAGYGLTLGPDSFRAVCCCCPLNIEGPWPPGLADLIALSEHARAHQREADALPPSVKAKRQGRDAMPSPPPARTLFDAPAPPPPEEPDDA